MNILLNGLQDVLSCSWTHGRRYKITCQDIVKKNNNR